MARKGNGKEAKLAFAGHALMENRHGLLVAVGQRLFDTVVAQVLTGTVGVRARPTPDISTPC